MPITKEDKEKIIKKFGKDKKDTGSTEVQVAILTHRISELTEHVKVHKKDKHTRRGLVRLVSQRKKLLKYLVRSDSDSYLKLIERMDMTYQFGGKRNFDLNEINDGEYNDWIGAQIRIDMYGWVLPGKPKLAAELARRDAILSHRGCAVEASAYIAGLCALIPESNSREEAVNAALDLIDKESEAYEAVLLGINNAGNPASKLHEHYGDMSPVHSLNNLSVVVWAFLSFQDSFDEAIGETICCGWDTDCTGATVGGLIGLDQGSIPELWTEPWQGRVLTAVAGVGELNLDDLVDRTCALVDKFSSSPDLT